MGFQRQRLGGLLCLLGLVFLSACSTTGSGDETEDARFILLQAKPRAYAIVEAGGRHEQARVRLAALEAAQYAPDAARDLARMGLGDENPAVRFAALVTIGKAQLRGLAEAASDLQQDENESVRAAAIFALKRCGREVDLSPLASMLTSGDAGARANAAMLIGQLGDVQAIGMLRESAGSPMPRVAPAERTWVRLQFAEAMIRLDPNDPEVLGTIRAGMYSNLDDVRVLSMQILGEIQDNSVHGGLAHIATRDNPIQIKIAAAQALARIGDRQGQPILLDGSAYTEQELEEELERYARRTGGSGAEAKVIRELLNDKALRERAAAEVRAQAAVALGWIETKKSARRLDKLLDDGDPIVQVAAASAVLRATR